METQVDITKALADIRIVSFDGKFTVASRVALNGNGIRQWGGGDYEVSKVAMKRLQKNFNVVCDF